MPNQTGLTTESEIAEAVLRVLSGNGKGRATYQELVREIPKILTLTSHDVEASQTRPNEEVWEQRVRNIRSHKKSEGNFIHSGYLSEIEGGLEITELGRKYISQR